MSRKRKAGTELAVQCLDSRQIVLHVECGDTVGSLKREVAAHWGIPASHMRWSVRGRSDVLASHEPASVCGTAVTCIVEDLKGMVWQQIERADLEECGEMQESLQRLQEQLKAKIHGLVHQRAREALSYTGPDSVQCESCNNTYRSGDGAHGETCDGCRCETCIQCTGECSDPSCGHDFLCQACTDHSCDVCGTQLCGDCLQDCQNRGCENRCCSECIELDIFSHTGSDHPCKKCYRNYQNERRRELIDQGIDPDDPEDCAQHGY